MRQRGDTSARTARTADSGECGQVDNWKDQSAAFPTTWIQQHIQDATAMRKPVSLCQSRQALSGPLCSNCASAPRHLPSHRAAVVQRFMLQAQPSLPCQSTELADGLLTA